MFVQTRYRLHTMNWVVQIRSGDKWADPGGTAIPGQPVIRLEQAPKPYPLTKMSLILKKA